MLPSNAIGDECVRELRKFNVDTSFIQRSDCRMGLYYLDAGANPLPVNVTYARACFTISLAPPGDIAWVPALAFWGLCSTH